MEQIEYLQCELGDLKEMLFQNVESLFEREEKIDELMTKTEELESQSLQFKTGTKKIQRSQWWAKNRIVMTMGTVTGIGLTWGLLMLI